MFAIVTLLAVVAQAPDPSSLYELSTAATTTALNAGEQGTWVLEIKPKAGAHVSDEAPLKIELSGKGVTPSKQKLELKDAVSKLPRFEVPFTAKEKGQSQLDAKVTFFICTDNVCARQQKTLSSAVKVN